MSNCVWCGGKSKIDNLTLAGDDRKTWRVKCIGKCKFHLSGFDTKKEALTEWNGQKSNSDSRLFGKLV